MTEQPTTPQSQPDPRVPQPNSPTLEVPVLGRGRLKPIWRLLIYLVLLSPLFALHYFLRSDDNHPPSAPVITSIAVPVVAVSETIPFLWIVLCTFIMSRIERRPIGYYGLDAAPTRLRQFALGLLTGIVSLSLLVAALAQLHLLVFNGRLLSGTAIARNAVIWLACFLLVGLFEEYFMRGYLQYILTRVLDRIAESLSTFFTLQLKPATTAAIAFWTAAAALSFLFGAGHGSNTGESPLGLVSAGLAGLLFCLSLWRTGSLWWAVGFHCTWDWAQSFLYGVGDSGSFIQGRLFDTTPIGRPILSGGATGPEGSILVLPTLALVVILVLLTLPKQPTPDIASPQLESPTV